jgi:hypothetical protein
MKVNQRATGASLLVIYTDNLPPAFGPFAIGVRRIATALKFVKEHATGVLALHPPLHHLLKGTVYGHLNGHGWSLQRKSARGAQIVECCNLRKRQLRAESRLSLRVRMHLPDV